MDNTTRNQHYISQAEQRNNCIDSKVDKKKQRIYKFEIVDREKDLVKLTGESGVKIETNLSFADLFSFDRKDEKVRSNFELFFQKYEVDLVRDSETLIQAVCSGGKAVDVKNVAMKVFKAKLMGAIRNPYCIGLTLSLFKSYLNVYPMDTKLFSDFCSVQEGLKPQLAAVSAEFEVSEVDYIAWLKVLFLALMVPKESSISMLESTVDGLFSSPDIACHLVLATYDDSGVYSISLPDTGRLQGTSDPSHNQFLFNISKCCFAAYSFLHLPRQTVFEVPIRMREYLKCNALDFSYQHRHNEPVLLEKFNGLSIYQSKKHIFCAQRTVYGLMVVI